MARLSTRVPGNVNSRYLRQNVFKNIRKEISLIRSDYLISYYSEKNVGPECI